jgi:hypothetical protein
MPLFLLKDKTLIKSLHDLGLKFQNDLNNMTEWSEESNPPTLFQSFKDNIISQTKDKAKVSIPKMEIKIKSLKHELAILLTNLDLEDEGKIAELAMHEEQIVTLEIQRHRNACVATAAHDRLKGETISKYWSQINKPRQPRDVIFSLEKPGSEPSTYVTRSNEMARLARDYHHNLLSDGLNNPPEYRAQITQKVLDSILPEDKLKNAPKGELAKHLTQEEVQEALKTSENGKATGINGIPYELWKVLDDKYECQAKKEKPAFNIIGALTKVYNDIEKHGVDKKTGFVSGWMCPLYKKNDKRNIANYRPITLLNSDYKVFTKALSMKLTTAVPSLGSGEGI